MLSSKGARIQSEKEKINSGYYIKKKISEVKDEIKNIRCKEKLAPDFETMNFLYAHRMIKRDELNNLIKMYKNFDKEESL